MEVEQNQNSVYDCSEFVISSSGSLRVCREKQQLSMPFDEVYENKRVLVTGHTGFKGSWLSLWLRELGARVVGYSLEPPSDPSNFEACCLKEKVVHSEGDVCHLDSLMSTFEHFEPQIVFHLAAQSLVRCSYEAPKQTFDTNMGGTVNLLEAVRQTPSVRVFINVTSDKCYENKEWIWPYRESDTLGGRDPYSASKACSELIFASYLKSFFEPSRNRQTALASVRAGNVIGGGDWGRDRLIPDCVRALSEDRPIVIRNPQSIRPWQHVLEPLSGYLWLGALMWGSRETYNGPWNFGPNYHDQLSVQEVVEQFIGIWGAGKWEHCGEAEEASHEATTLKLCCDKARSRLGWQGTLSLEETLSYTAQWYKEYYNSRLEQDMYPFCCRQIQQYTREAAGHIPWAD